MIPDVSGKIPPTKAINLTKSTSDLEGYSFHFSMFGSRTWSCIAQGWLKIHPTRCFGRQSLQYSPFDGPFDQTDSGCKNVPLPADSAAVTWLDPQMLGWSLKFTNNLSKKVTLLTHPQKGHDFSQNCQLLDGFLLGILFWEKIKHKATTPGDCADQSLKMSWTIAMWVFPKIGVPQMDGLWWKIL